jgi:hypothetical protein
MQKDFQEQLIKGKITEIIFQQMMVQMGKYTILPLGYESVLPELIERHNSEILKPLRSAPDFVLIPRDENDENILIVEIKFRRHITAKNNLEIASEQNRRWNPSYLFVATPDCFYFDKCVDIIRNNGIMNPLQEWFVSSKLQTKYLNMLNKFLG